MRSLHQRSLAPIVVTIIGLMAAVMVGTLVVKGMSFGKAAQMGIIFGPVFIAMALCTRRLWPGIMLGLLVVAITPVRMAILHHFSVDRLFALVVIALVLGAICIRRYRSKVVRDPAAWLICATGVIVIGRIIMNPPGSATAGIGDGGGGQAMMFAVGFLSFFAFSKVAATDWDIKRSITIACGIAIASLIFSLIKFKLHGGGADFEGEKRLLQMIYRTPGWLVGSFLSAWIMARYAHGRGSLLRVQNILLGMGALLAVSVFTPHRSRPLFALSTLISSGYVYRRTTFVLVMAALIVGGGVGILMVLSPDMIPPTVRRSLSTVLPVSEQERQRILTQQKMSGEMGWESEFRAKMYASGWERIKSNPLIGVGFAFSAQDLNALLATRARKGTIVDPGLTGGYHNALFQMAVVAGIPAALMFTIGMLVMLWKFAKYARALDPGDEKFFATVLLGFVFPIIGQMTMNGAGKEVFAVCTILGIANGLMVRAAKKPATVSQKRLTRRPPLLAPLPGFRGSPAPVRNVAGREIA